MNKIKNKFNLIDILVISYYIIISIILPFSSKPISVWWLYFLNHIVIITLVFLIINISKNNKNKLIHFIRFFYPIILLTFSYKELNNLIPIISSTMHDSIISTFEYKLFGFYPTIMLQKITTPLLTEFLKIAYFSYYFMVFIPPIILYFNKKYKALNEFIETILIAFYICYICFIFFPIAGPRFLLKEIYTVKLTGFIFTPFQDFVMRHGESIGACMPSSHVAAGVTSLIMVYKHLKKGIPLMTFAVFFMCIATVYLRYHYASDVIMGIATSIIAVFLRSKLTNLNYISKESDFDKPNILAAEN